VAYSLTFTLALGAAHASETLGARLITWTGSGYTAGSIITTNFDHRGGGNWLWSYDSFTEGFQGAVEFGVYSGSALTSILAVASVNPQDEAVMKQTVSELTTVPGASPTVEKALALLYMALRNKLVTESAVLKYYNDAGSIWAHADLTDTGTVFTRDELETGP
jgi:hypothetical protein